MFTKNVTRVASRTYQLNVVPSVHTRSFPLALPAHMVMTCNCIEKEVTCKCLEFAKTAAEDVSVKHCCKCTSAPSVRVVVAYLITGCGCA